MALNEEEGKLDRESDVDDCARQSDSETKLTDEEQVAGREPMLSE
jgi:hypothetical protein